MIKSKYFWLAAIMIAIIPVLGIDITQHYLDWQKEVREELITVVQDLYSFNKQQKANILDKVFERNQTLMFLIYLKSFVILILLSCSFYFFKLYKKQQRPKLLKPLFYIIAIIVCFTLTKFFLINRITTNENIKFLTINPSASSFQQLYNDNFKGKVVYVDFWGTTCGPCLQEFRNFTKPLKDKYKQRGDIKYLYIGQGNKYLWHEQIKKYNIEGYHILLMRHNMKNSIKIQPKTVLF
ncbi:hypothetical protein [Flavobacterium sp. MDT1-60]|uniref:hypothetical protein n=1 Tax=Flavobacterium sp. MDT1-60 TaxID=1979344 RepID=UPI00177BD282|nr:hypothetical protein [Flavobacterium sp. MDT1-60]QOG02032.1 hypothetical protein IHE43_19860 [Flavobacterium sp. MDT1-60]